MSFADDLSAWFVGTYGMTHSQARCVTELLKTSRTVEIAFEQSSPALSNWCVAIALRRLRKGARKPQREVAADLEIGTRFVGEIENAKHKPSILQLRGMLGFYAAEPSDLRTGLELLVRRRGC